MHSDRETSSKEFFEARDFVTIERKMCARRHKKGWLLADGSKIERQDKRRNGKTSLWYKKIRKSKQVSCAEEMCYI